MWTDNGLLDTILNNFKGAISGSWGPSLSGYLLPLLMALVVLQFGMIAIEAAVARDIPLLLMHILLGIIRVSIVVAIFDHASEWGNDIVQTGQDIGVAVSGFSPATLTPSGVFDTGLSVARAIAHAKAAGGWLSELFQSLEFLLVACAVFVSWLIASVLYLGCLLEASLLVYVGPLVIAFTPLSWTFDMLIIWGKSLLQIAFKLALILMTLAIGMVLANQWVAETTASATTFTTDLWPLFIIIAEAAMVAWLVWKLPSKIAGLSAGAAALGFGEGLIAMGGTAAGNSMSSRGSGGGSGGGNSGGGGEGGGGSSPGLLSQAGQAAISGAKALAHKVQAKLTT